MSRPNMRTAWLLVADALRDVAEWYEVAEAVAYAVDVPPGEWPAVAAAIRAMCVEEDAPPPADVALQALANRTLTADLEAARADVRRVIAERDEARRNYQFMVERAADRHLGGYRELAAKCAASEAERDEARSRAARLTRILAVERGDQTQAPVGWQRYGDAAWRIPGPGGVVIQRACDGMLDTWIRRGVLRDDPRCRVWSTALEAMEAIDAERGGVPHA